MTISVQVKMMVQIVYRWESVMWKALFSHREKVVSKKYFTLSSLSKHDKMLKLNLVRKWKIKNKMSFMSKSLHSSVCLSVVVISLSQTP